MQPLNEIEDDCVAVPVYDVSTEAAGEHIITQDRAGSPRVEGILAKLRRQKLWQRLFGAGAVFLGLSFVLINLASMFAPTNQFVWWFLYPIVNLLPRLITVVAPGNVLVNWLPTMVILGICLTLVLLSGWQRRKSSRTLAQLDDVRVVGALAEALGLGEKRLSTESSAMLARLLPRLRASDAGLLSSKQRLSLVRALRNCDAALAIAILDALERVGEVSLIASIENAATVRDRRMKDAAVQEKVVECVRALRERQETRRASETLLRADTAAAGADALLRPAESVRTAGSNLLLQPAELESKSLDLVASE